MLCGGYSLLFCLNWWLVYLVGLRGELHTDLAVCSSGLVFASHYRWPSAVDESLDGLVDLKLVDEALEDGLAGNW